MKVKVVLSLAPFGRPGVGGAWAAGKESETPKSPDPVTVRVGDVPPQREASSSLESVSRHRSRAASVYH